MKFESNRSVSRNGLTNFFLIGMTLGLLCTTYLLWKTRGRETMLQADLLKLKTSSQAEISSLQQKVAQLTKDVARAQEDTKKSEKTRDDQSKDLTKVKKEKDELAKKNAEELKKCQDSTKETCAKESKELRIKILNTVYEKVNASAIKILGDNGISLEGFDKVAKVAPK